MKEETSAPIRPQDLKVPPEVIELISRNIAERHRVCPIALADHRGVRTLTVATPEPNDLMLFDKLSQMTACRIMPVLALADDIMRAIDLHYGRRDMVEQPTDLIQQFGGGEAMVNQNGAAGTNGNSNGASVDARGGASNTVEGILQRAIAERASDIHIEPQQKLVYVRFRVDGVMYDHTTYNLDQHAQVISRIKILSKLDIAQNRLPQDGRFDVVFGTKEFDVRVSLIPTSGDREKAVLRMLPKGQMALEFEQLGLIGENRKLLDELINKPFGMVLVTGPTGSGKTTTLYACLSKIDCVGKNVITVEDPIEYQFPRITQIQVHPRIGLTFAAGLRAILRQDPDVIMVGEIRDLETLSMAMQSALTGHMVMSTLHCNDAAAGAARMIDMGAEPFLIASSVNGIVAQRLVRKICQQCKVATPVSEPIRARLQLPDDGTAYYHGRGCQHCRGTGYSGRISVFEVVPALESIQQAIVRKAPASEIRECMHAAGCRTLRDDGLEKARAGITSLEEVMRAVFVEHA